MGTTIDQINCAFYAWCKINKEHRLFMFNDGAIVFFATENNSITSASLSIEELSKLSVIDTVIDALNNAAKLFPLTFGQEAVGVQFHPSGDDAVYANKQWFANAIDQMNDLRNHPESTAGKKRHASTAITDIETAQMRAVKALTWRGK